MGAVLGVGCEDGSGGSLCCGTRCCTLPSSLSYAAISCPFGMRLDPPASSKDVVEGLVVEVCLEVGVAGVIEGGLD